MKDIPSVEESVFAANFFNTKLRPKEAVDPIALRTTSLVRHISSQEQGKQETAPRPPSLLFSTQYAESLPTGSDPINVTGSYDPETQQWSSYSSLWNWAAWTTICRQDTYSEEWISVSTANCTDTQEVLFIVFDDLQTQD